MFRQSAPASARPVTDSDRLRVFVSYARRDASDFAEYLVVALKLNGFDAYLDRHDIAPGEPWEARLGALLTRSDSVVFVITPASVKSERCGWELNRAVALGKRLVPVQWVGVPEADVPDALKTLNYTVFTSGQPFADPLADLDRALRQNLAWLRRLTDLSESAKRWDALGRDPDLLLRGAFLAEAVAWEGERNRNAPEIPPVLNAFIGASEDADKARQSEAQRRLREKLQILVAALVITLGLFGAAIYEWRAAVAAENNALEAKSSIDGLIKRIKVGRSKDEGVRAMQETCAAAVTSIETMATTKDPSEFSANADRFRQLYWGGMNLLELRQATENYDGTRDSIVHSLIETAMVRANGKLKEVENAGSEVPPSSLIEHAREVDAKCADFLGAK